MGAAINRMSINTQIPVLGHKCPLLIKLNTTQKKPPTPSTGRDICGWKERGVGSIYQNLLQLLLSGLAMTSAAEKTHKRVLPSLSTLLLLSSPS